MAIDNIKLVIFDWDGTLMDSTQKICNAMQAAAEQLCLPIPSHEAVKGIIGLSLGKAFRVLFGELMAEHEQELTTVYSHQYRVTDTTPSPLFSETEATLQDLSAKGYQLAIATGKSRAGLTRVLGETNLNAHFVASRCADEAQSKPNPEMLLTLAAELDYSASQCLMIGDTSFDMEMAQRAGMPRIAVSYGAHSVEQMQIFKPQATIDCISELRTILN